MILPIEKEEECYYMKKNTNFTLSEFIAFSIISVLLVLMVWIGITEPYHSVSPIEKEWIDGR